MSNTKGSSYNHPNFKPFQSGSTLCYPSKDYANFKGGHNSLISTKPGKNLYKDINYKMSKESLKSLNGKSYSTSAGGSKRKTSNKKGGNVFTSSPAPLKGGVAPVSEEQTGGRKGCNKNKKVKKGGMISVSEEQTGGKNGCNKNKKVKKGGMAPVGEESVLSGGKKTTKPKTTKKKVTKPKTKATKSKKMKGGKESEGATGMPIQFYKNNQQLPNYTSNNGLGVNTVYGVISPKDAGVGNLAPYNTSVSANKNSMLKTGGRKYKKKGGLSTIPRVSDRPFRVVDKIANKGASAIKSFFEGVKKNYEKSLVKIQQTKNGLNRLSKGGSKRKVLKGGNGSDFSSTLSSRGPWNTPDKGEKHFRVFNKSSPYIKNKDLPYAAAPILTNSSKNTKVTGYSTFESTYASLKGGKKKSPKKPVSKKSTSKKPVSKKSKKTAKK
tara:strand:- start:268 stop:1578 length:1311 start_codon:yes stop_codon:yes gene_type:complete